MEYRVTNVNENVLNFANKTQTWSSYATTVYYCKNKVVILAKCLATTVVWLPLLCNFMNVVPDKIHAVGTDTWEKPY